MKKFSKLFFRLVSFVLVLLVLLLASSLILQPKSNAKEAGMLDSSANGILGEPENTIDALVIGDSEAYSAFIPLEIWAKHGITSYVCATSAQILCYSYEFLQKTFEKQQPRVVFLETNAIYRSFSFSDIAIQKLSESLSVFRYHDRWKTLSLRDWSFGVDLSSTEITKGYIYNNGVEPAKAENYMKKTDAAEKISSENKRYVELMKNLCEQNGAKLVLVSSPSPKNWNTPRHNAVKALSGELGLEYIDMNLMGRKIPIDWTRDTKDKGDHLNYSGALKATAFIGKYLEKQGIFEDKRNNGEYSQWNDAVSEFSKQIGKRPEVGKKPKPPLSKTDKTVDFSSKS